MEKNEFRRMLAELYRDFWEEEEKKHGYNYNELSFSANAFLRWLGQHPKETITNKDETRSL